MIGWIPVLGPLTLGVLAARAEPGPRALLAVLPALGAQTLGLLALRAVAGAVQDRHLDGWVWSAVGWLLSPLGAALGRPFSQLVADSSAMMFVLVFTFPVLLGLLLGTLSRAR